MTARRRLVVGTRGSRLALKQTQLVIAALRMRHSEVDFDVREVRTEGDRKPDASLATIGGQGVFVKEIEAALLRGEVDVGVHSLKDVPPDLPEGLTLAAVPARGDARDALVTGSGAPLESLSPGARIGTGSPRRAVQLRALRPDIECADVRGNVDTRLRKVDEGQYDGVVLAAAALERMGLLDRAAQLFDPEVMLPAVGQGALVIEARTDDGELLTLLSSIEDAPSRLTVDAERAFLSRLGGGCRLPVGALAAVDGSSMHIRGMLADETGARIVRGTSSGPSGEAQAAGARLAEQLLEAVDG